MDKSGEAFDRNQLGDDTDIMERYPPTMKDTQVSPTLSHTDVVQCGNLHPDKNSLSVLEACLPTDEDTSLTNHSSVSLVKTAAPLVYKISDNPPIHLTIVFAFQQALLAFATQLMISLLVAQAVHGEHDPVLRSNLLGSTMFMCGFTTVIMSIFGPRLPIFQGGTTEYIIPLLVLQDAGPDRCDITATTTGTTKMNATYNWHNSNYSQYRSLSNITQMVDGRSVQGHQDVDFDKLRGSDKIDVSQNNSNKIYLQMMGSLMIAGSIHSVIGLTGLVGVLLRFVGPITVAPTVLLVGLWMAKIVANLISIQWGIGVMTASISVILSLYLGNWKMPVPFWTWKKGLHIIRSNFHQTAAILIALLSGWAMCAILTACGVFSDDPHAPDYFARTDIMPGVIQNASWIYFPYPGQFGVPSFNGEAFVGFFIATMISILDSIADYYACALACNLPPPPVHAVNRGVAVEGFCSFLSGTLGCGHSTSSYGGNIGAIRVTKVASRRVFQMVGFIFMLFGIVGKLCAVFITIPKPVLGGTMLIMVSMFIGVMIANLQHVDLTSNRNLAIMGIAIAVGTIIPYWIEKNPDRLKTGNEALDQILDMVFGNATVAGAVLACILDNTIAGTPTERGLTAWRDVTSDEQGDVRIKEGNMYTDGLEIYDPVVPGCVRGWKGFKYIPFMPDALAYTSNKGEKKEII
ncbi:solute carrier family 23 member 1-like [Ylistrum balloti]|uniref:solute carrier family 23 member 1-like n=1 Tax=Ylistrum balloti TaxID=509963 RepID=UPI00290591AE|nr:solute carrier family 23 member 1-like [Ylistrum balloti]